MTEKQTVFVYGILKRGRSCSLEDEEFVGEAVLKGATLFQFPGAAFPFIDIDKSENYVRGEVFNVSAHKMRELDQIEGYPDFYDRCVVTPEVEGAGPVNAWVYHLTGEFSKDSLNRLRKIESGVWGQ